MTEFPTDFDRFAIGVVDALEEEELDDGGGEGATVAEDVRALVLRVAVGETAAL